MQQPIDPLDEDDYPTDEALEYIKNFDLITEKADVLISFIKEIWHWGMDQIDHKGNVLTLHTGGWSGNELILRALSENLLFWSLFWVSSQRGGHHTFRIDELPKA